MIDRAAILRHQARDGNVFDTSNDTVVVTRALLTSAADEIERLRTELQDAVAVERERCAKIAAWAAEHRHYAEAKRCAAQIEREIRAP